MSLDLTGEPFPCEMCVRFPMGGFNWKCKRCQARAFVLALKWEQKYTQRLWKESMPETEYEAMRKLVAEERARKQEANTS